MPSDMQRTGAAVPPAQEMQAQSVSGWKSERDAPFHSANMKKAASSATSCPVRTVQLKAR